MLRLECRLYLIRFANQIYNSDSNNSRRLSRRDNSLLLLECQKHPKHLPQRLLKLVEMYIILCLDQL